MNKALNYISVHLQEQKAIQSDALKNLESQLNWVEDSMRRNGGDDTITTVTAPGMISAAKKKLSEMEEWLRAVEVCWTSYDSILR